MAAPAATPPQPAPAPPMTAEEFGLRYSGEHVKYINDIVVRPPMAGPKHGKVTNLMAYHLTGHVLANDLGHVLRACPK